MDPLTPMAELLPALRSGALSAEALLERGLDAIRVHDGPGGPGGVGLSAILRLNPDAVARARRLDRARERAEPLGPLHGIPLVLKDNIDLTGLPTTSGATAMRGALPHRDAESVARLKAAGAVIVAKTHMSELSFEIRSRSSLGGDVRNPFNRAVTAGGSSGGTAAAVAAGFAVAGLGSDTGGSIRVPAAYTGLVGLRPSQGLVDRRGVAPLAPTTDTVGPIARCVDDVRRLMAVITDAPHAAAFDAPSAMAAGLEGVRFGVLRQGFGASSEVISVIEGALEAVARAGGILVDPVSLTDQLLPEGRDNVVDWEFAPAWNAYLARNFQEGTAPASLAEMVGAGAHLPEYGETLRRRLAERSLDAPAYRAILAYHADLRTALTELMDRQALAALIYPTSAVAPASLAKPEGGWAPELAACTGWPAVTLPAGLASNGVPIGLELLGRPFQDARLLGLAAALERQLDRRYVPIVS